eukprot:15142014-Alexandrium_andersonii.AAC.1
MQHQERRRRKKPTVHLREQAPEDVEAKPASKFRSPPGSQGARGNRHVNGHCLAPLMPRWPIQSQRGAMARATFQMQ